MPWLQYAFLLCGSAVYPCPKAVRLSSDYCSPKYKYEVESESLDDQKLFFELISEEIKGLKIGLLSKVNVGDSQRLFQLIVELMWLSALGNWVINENNFLYVEKNVSFSGAKADFRELLKELG